jgi:hypothetical protein
VGVGVRAADGLALGVAAGTADGRELGEGPDARRAGDGLGVGDDDGGLTDLVITGAGWDGLPPGEVGAVCGPAEVAASTPTTTPMIEAAAITQSRAIRFRRRRSPRRITSAGGSGRARSAP